MTFAALCSIGTVFAFQFADNHEQAHRDDARQLAIKTGKFFSSKLDQAVLPLFSMAQFVYEIDVFRDLPGLVGDLGAPGALPLLPTPVQGGAAYRNVTGVCDDPELVSRFNAIAASMKHNAGVEGILVNLQLSPVAVVCLAYPLNNTKDFPPGIFLDNTGIIGYDILRDPARSFTAEETLRGDKIVTSGPLKLMQCKDCDPTVEKAFIARLPIAMDRYNITVHGEPLRRWGFATALINWEALVDRSMIREEFRENNLHFRLIRPEKKLNTATGDNYVEDILLAESDGFVSDNGQAESVELNTTDNVWRITIGSVDGFRPMNMQLIIWAVVAASIVISFMLLLVLVENHAYGDLLKEILPPCALRKIQNGETVVEQYDMISVFFSDIIGYTTMVAEMSPISVMEMLNEYYSKMDRLAEKHRVYKVETIGGTFLHICQSVPKRTNETFPEDPRLTLQLSNIRLLYIS
jgi:sensor domain CHASE-containing protein